MTTKLADILLPSVVPFGPIFLMMGFPTTPLWYVPYAGAMMMVLGGFLMLGKVRRLEQRLEEMEKRLK